MGESVEALERRLERLRVAVREAVLGGDREHARALRAELKQAERAWDDALDQAAAQALPAQAPAEGQATVEQASACCFSVFIWAKSNRLKPFLLHSLCSRGGRVEIGGV